MRVLVLDIELMALDFALRCAEAGHDVRLYRHMPKRQERVGEGFKQITLVDDWRPHMQWAKDGLILCTGNFTLLWELYRYREFGYRIFAPSPMSARLEIDRMAGIEAAKAAGIAVPEYHEFGSFEEAEAFARKSDRAYVFKPGGDEENKALTYVADDPADLVGWLRRQTQGGKKVKKCLLQEKIDLLAEIGVSGWMGYDGFLADKWQICFEHKKLMNGERGPNCFSSDSEVLTKEGWKFWPEVTMDDEICTLVNGQITYEQPSQVVIGDFDGELIGWQSPYVDILVTPGHNMYVQDDHYRREFFFESAADAADRRRTIMRTGGEWVGSDPQLADEEAHAALLGAYIADGYCRKSEVVFGNLPAHKLMIFKDIISAAGYGYSIRDGNYIVIGGRLSECFADYGLAHQKYVPRYIKNARKSVIEAFLFGYGSGDGTTRPNNLTYTTISKRLADDLQELALKVGWAASVAVRDRRGESHMIGEYECINMHVAYDVRISKQRQKAEISPEILYREAYRGKVYCVTVSSHIIYVRRNGKPCWIGQTGEMGTICQYYEDDKLADQVLKPMETALQLLGHCGDFAFGGCIDTKGKPWFFEWTARMGYPSWWIQQASHRGDPANWMRALLYGDDSLRVSYDVAAGIVCGQPRFPYNASSPELVEGNPIYGVEEHRDQIHLASVMMGRGPKMEGGKIVEGPQYQTTGEYVLVCTGLGKTVTSATRKAMRAAEGVRFPDKIMRTDIGDKVKDWLPQLRELGYALDMAP